LASRSARSICQSAALKAREAVDLLDEQHVVALKDPPHRRGLRPPQRAPTVRRSDVDVAQPAKSWDRRIIQFDPA
jgi:hypothetical protein